MAMYSKPSAGQNVMFAKATILDAGGHPQYIAEDNGVVYDAIMVAFNAKMNNRFLVGSQNTWENIGYNPAA